jgi:PIN domain nuclease of toxin-antitoxin system
VTDGVVLDTHVWYWFVAGRTNRLARPVVRRIERAVSGAHAFVSAMSAWELGMLVAKGRLTLSMDVADWIDASREPPGIRVADVTTEIAVDGARLLAFPTGDPADRIIVATARSMGAALITCDERILDYGATQVVKLVDGRR